MLESALIAYARNFPVRRGKLRVVEALWRYAAGTGSLEREAKLRFGGLRMRVDLAEQLQRQFYFFGTYFIEDEMLDVWRHLASRSRIVLDVGANRGIYSLAALDASPNARIIAFEPTPEIARDLRATKELNHLKHLEVVERAVMDKVGPANLVIYRGGDGTNGGMNFIREAWQPSSDEETRGVEAITIDAFCSLRGIDRIDLMKIDVQGHEPAVLDGAKDMLELGLIRNIFVELNWSSDNDELPPADKVIAALAAANYRFAEPRFPLCWKSAGSWLRGTSDIIASRTS